MAVVTQVDLAETHVDFAVWGSVHGLQQAGARRMAIGKPLSLPSHV